ncbi:helix-turn-helix domain-containing protein [Lactiplantibacillus modestisalitolerans]|uniref:Helix-turn-helix domain-containing protein n=2 Tax=Lactiplantibacillus modestisalitolerans TaxID=1457219 RepID=A0ABV5WSV3_9LACO
MDVFELAKAGTKMHRLLVKWTFKRKMMAVGGLIILSIYLIVIAFNLLLQGPIQNHLMSQSATSIKRQIQTANTQVSNLETYAYTLSTALNANQLPASLQTVPTSLAPLNQASNQLFLLENDSTLINAAVIFVATAHPYVINSSGTSQNTLSTYQPLAQASQTRQWRYYHHQLFLLQPVGSTQSNRQATLIIQVATDKLISRYTPTVGHNHSSLVVAGHQPFGDDLRKVLPAAKKSVVWYGNRRYRVLKYQVSHLGQIWTYYSLLSLSNIFDAISDVSIWIIIISFIVFGLFTALVIWFRQNFYTPVQTMMRLAGTPTDELQALQYQWERLLNQQSTAAVTAAQDKERLQTNFLVQAIQGRLAYLGTAEIDQKAHHQGLASITSNPVCFIRIQITDTISPTSHRVTDDPNLANFMFNNVVSDLAKQHLKSAYTIDNEEHAVTLLTPAVDAGVLHQFYRQVSASLNHLLARYVTVIIGMPVHDWAQLKPAANRIQAAASYQQLRLANQELLLATIDVNTFNVHLPIADVSEAQLLTALKNLDAAPLAPALDRLLANYFEAQRPQIVLFNSLEKLYFDVRNLIQNYGLPLAALPTEQELLASAAPLFRQADLAQLINASLLQPTLHLLQTTHQQTAQEKMQRILSYLKANFSDPTLSLEQTADQFNLDSYTLSKVFKTQTNTTYTDYLTGLRLNFVKEALRSSTKLINVIATEAGYQPSYFNRVFKQHFGMTPGQYRKQA